MEVAGPLGTPLGLAQRKRASPRGESSLLPLCAFLPQPAICSPFTQVTLSWCMPCLFLLPAAACARHPTWNTTTACLSPNTQHTQTCTHIPFPGKFLFGTEAQLKYQLCSEYFLKSGRTHFFLSRCNHILFGSYLEYST